ncbi:MAG TPA: hypothetical protein VMG10_26345 [Gemmataceae bacterium]|nr:hypothetical protein [Gemmataceae bacterium]
MHGYVLGLLGLVVAADPIEMAKDVYEIRTRQLAMPIRVATNYRDKVTKMRLFVSEDQGKTWKHKKDYKPSAKQAVFTAPRDGLYWFALQVVLKDGGIEPADLDDLLPVMKVYVNAERKPFQTKKSYDELQREVEQLRKTVEQLQKRIKQLESERKPK